MWWVLVSRPTPKPNKHIINILPLLPKKTVSPLCRGEKGTTAMEKKKLSERIGYIPARLSVKKDRWEVVYYQTDPADGLRKRHRETGDLNRVRDLRERKRQAIALIGRINALLPAGYPHRTPEQIEARAATPTVAQALKIALDIKLKTDREETRKDYRSIGGVFLAWAASAGVGECPVSDFSKRQALDFLDYVATRPTRAGGTIGNRTWNNYKTKISTMFNELVRREVLAENPFRGISKKTVWGKSRRKCTPDERAAIAAWLWEHDYYTFLFVTLEYYCLLRGTELRRLRAGDFDLSRGIICLEAQHSKTKRERFPTMPVYVRELLADARFAAIPTNYFVFGDGGAPQPKKSWGRSFAWRRLRRCLVDLVEAGKLGDVEGISPYSFKDTGITEWLRLLPLPQVMQQAGHTNPGTTMLYNQPDLINEGFAKLKARIDSIISI